jgi:hypothetical protein
MRERESVCVCMCVCVCVCAHLLGEDQFTETAVLEKSGEHSGKVFYLLIGGVEGTVPVWITCGVVLCGRGREEVCSNGER